MRTYAALCSVLILTGTLASGSQTATLNVDGHSLPLKARAARSEMFGLVQLYQVTLYAPLEATTREALQGADTAKALVVDVQYDGSLPDQIPADWREELTPVLSEGQAEALRNAYARLGPADTIRIAYAPGEGTSIVVSGKQVINNAGHNLMAAFLDIWLGQTPVSDEIKETLLNGLQRG